MQKPVLPDRVPREWAVGELNPPYCIQANSQGLKTGGFPYQLVRPAVGVKGTLFAPPRFFLRITISY